MKSTNRKPLEFTANPNNPELSQRKNRQKDFLHFLAQGKSINDACALVGVTRSAYEQWRVRHEGFPEAVEATREAHRQDILCGRTASSTPIAADSAAQPLHENPDNPDKPYKPLQPNLTANPYRISSLTYPNSARRPRGIFQKPRQNSSRPNQRQPAQTTQPQPALPRLL